MSYLKDIVKYTHPVIFASQLYAETLNSTSISNHIKNVIRPTIKEANEVYLRNDY